jgi:hypothetical protein
VLPPTLLSLRDPLKYDVVPSPVSPIPEILNSIPAPPPATFGDRFCPGWYPFQSHAPSYLICPFLSLAAQPPLLSPLLVQHPPLRPTKKPLPLQASRHVIAGSTFRTLLTLHPFSFQTSPKGDSVTNDHLGKYFLGYASINVLLPFDGGNGPAIVSSDYQRAEDRANTDDLFRRVGGLDADKPGHALRRFDPANAMCMGVDPSVLNLTSLSKDPYGTVSRVKWNTDAKASSLVRFTGFHRTLVLRRLCKVSLAKLDKLPELSPQRNPLLHVLNEEGLWLVALYDIRTLSTLLYCLTPS